MIKYCAMKSKSLMAPISIHWSAITFQNRILWFCLQTQSRTRLRPDFFTHPQGEEAAVNRRVQRGGQWMQLQLHHDNDLNTILHVLWDITHSTNNVIHWPHMHGCATPEQQLWDTRSPAEACASAVVPWHRPWFWSCLARPILPQAWVPREKQTDLENIVCRGNQNLWVLHHLEYHNYLDISQNLRSFDLYSASFPYVWK